MATVKVTAVKEMLDYENKTWVVNDEHRLFDFGANRKLTDEKVLARAHLMDIYLTKDSSDVCDDEAFFLSFPELIRAFSDTDSRLVVSLTSDESNTLDTIRNFENKELTTSGKMSFRTSCRRPDCIYQNEILFFEWDIKALEAIRSKWFHFLVEFEGFLVPPHVSLNLFKQFANKDIDDKTLILLLDEIILGFRLWTDKDGMFLATTKFTPDDVCNRLIRVASKV